MRRMQIQIDDPTYTVLRQCAARERRSMTAIVRELLSRHLPGRASRAARMRTSPASAGQVTPATRFPKSIDEIKFIGCFASGRPQDRVSERHDEILGEGRW